MKKSWLAFIAILFAASLFAQKITKVTLANNSNVELITFELNDKVLLNVSKDGKVINWGVDDYIGPGENCSGRLAPYVGRVEYYSAADNEALQGKVKYIGSTLFTYYPSYENDLLKGKIKSIGQFNIDYNGNYDDASIRGNIKLIGDIAVSWFTSLDNEAYKGKLKSFGPTAFTYYTSFDDAAYKGKIKSIDKVSFTYYSSFDRREYWGAMKSGTPLSMVNGIKYFAKN
jgi:hypothetical protein